MSFSERSKAQTGMEKPFAVAIIVGWVIMFIRVMIEIAVVNNKLTTFSLASIGSDGWGWFGLCYLSLFLTSSY